MSDYTGLRDLMDELTNIVRELEEAAATVDDVYPSFVAGIAARLREVIGLKVDEPIG